MGLFQSENGVPCFSLGLLKDIAAHEEALLANGGASRDRRRSFEVSHYVLASRTPGVFNMGGDLALFALLIKAQDRRR